MAENNKDKSDVNYEDLVNSLQSTLQFNRSELIDKESKIIELEKKVLRLHKENQEKLLQYDDMYTQLKFVLQKTDLILVQERMSYQEQKTSQYFELMQSNFELMHANDKISELEQANNEFINQLNNLRPKLESEVNKFTMMRNAYSGVFEAFISNFIKLYSSLDLPTEFLESISTDHESKIENIFDKFPQLIKTVDNIKRSESNAKELEISLKHAKDEINNLNNTYTTLLSEKKELEEKLTKQNEKLNGPAIGTSSESD